MTIRTGVLPSRSCKRKGQRVLPLTFYERVNGGPSLSPKKADLLKLEAGHDPSDPTTRARAVVAERHLLSTLQSGHGVIDPQLRAGRKRQFEGKVKKAEIPHHHRKTSSAGMTVCCERGGDIYAIPRRLIPCACVPSVFV